MFLLRPNYPQFHFLSRHFKQIQSLQVFHICHLYFPLCHHQHSQPYFQAQKYFKTELLFVIIIYNISITLYCSFFSSSVRNLSCSSLYTCLSGRDLELLKEATELTSLYAIVFSLIFGSIFRLSPM